MPRTLSFLFLLFLPVVAWADGVVFPPVAYPARVTIPDQRALICWSNGTERLAIETQFSGEGTNFAWVVPLPSKPVIEEATPGLFNTLEFIFRPAIIHDVFPFYSLLLVLTGIACLVFTVRRNTPLRKADMVVSLLVALAMIPLSVFIAVLLLFLLPYVVWQLRAGREWLLSTLAILFLALLLGGMLLPALSTAGVSITTDGISILSRETVGVYDTTTITANEPQALAKWLNDNGYAVPPAANGIVSDYVSRGWVFVAAKLHRDSAGRVVNSPQPLCFTFQTDQAVYPMQLTGIGNTNLTVQLFVFGPARAEAKYFHADRCAATTVPNPKDYFFALRSSGPIPVSHPLLRKWAAGLPVATKLEANLNSEEMAGDVKLQWTPFTEIQRTFYSYSGARTFSFNCGVGIFVVLLSLAGIAIASKPDSKLRLQRMIVPAAIAGLITGTLVFVAVPKRNVRLVSLPTLFSRENLGELELAFREEYKTNPVSTLAESRVAFKKIQAKYPKLDQNLLLGGRLREEDSPGNYILRQGTNGLEFIWFDAAGGEHSLDK